MNSTPTLGKGPSVLEWLIFKLSVYGVLGVVGGPLLLAFSLFLVWLFGRVRLTVRLFAVGLSVGWLGVLYWLLRRDYASFQADLQFVFAVWLLAVPLGPLVAVVLKELDKLRPRSLSEELREREEWLRARQDKLASDAARRREDSEEPGRLRLGSFVKGDRFKRTARIQAERGWVSLDEKALDEHIFLLGTTGAGKTEALKRIIDEVFAVTDRNLYFVDGKGEEALANDVRGLAYKHDRGVAPIFRLGLT